VSLYALHAVRHIAMSTFKHHVITVLMILSSVLAGCAQHDEYIAAALEHADHAITNGQERDNNALAEQATVALRYAWLAERNNRDSRLQDAIRLLKEAIKHARYGRSDTGVQAVKDAYKLLAEIE
jgi:hypothetical protein